MSSMYSGYSEHTRQDDEPVGGGYAVWTGLAPGALVALTLAISAAVTALARLLAFPLGFLIWQWIMVAIWSVGLLVAAIVYIVSVRRALRNVAAWRQAGLGRPSTLAYVALVISALLMLLPVILAMTLPQHPAP